MKRVGLWIALALSLGFNVGFLASRLGLADFHASGDRHPGWAEAHRRAAGGPGRPPFEIERGEVVGSLERAAEHLGLEGEAREGFVSRHHDLITAVLAARAERRSLERELGRELGATEPDRERVEATIVKLAENRSDVERRFADTVLATRASLAPGQERRYLRLVRILRSHLAGRRVPGDRHFLPRRGSHGPADGEPAPATPEGPPRP